MSMRTLLVIVASATLALPLAISAATPNLQSGQWEYTNLIEFEGDMPMAMEPQTHTSRECVTDEDLARGDAFLDDAEACDVNSIDLHRDGMSYSMVCREDGAEVQMDADIRFMGDRMEGLMTAQLDTPMGPMNMRTTIDGRRVGECR